MKAQVNARISAASREKLDALTAIYGTQAEVLAVAIDRLYTATFQGKQAMTTEEQARQRVSEIPELDEISETIFYDWPNWDEHMRWIATAPVAEIVDWAETVTTD